jgi:hypothetical protein
VRDRLFWRVLANAATKPLNVLALAGMTAASILITPWVLPAAGVVYGLMVLGTIRDPQEQAKIAAAAGRAALPSPGRSLQGITGDLRMKVIAALNEERAIMTELERAPVQPEGMREQITALNDELLEFARRASEVDLYLATVDPDELQRRAKEYEELGRHSERARDAADALNEQLQVIESLGSRRIALDDEIVHVSASLGAIRARLVQARTEAAPPAVIATDVTELRDRMRAIAESLGEAYGQNTSTSTKGN